MSSALEPLRLASRPGIWRAEDANLYLLLGGSCGNLGASRGTVRVMVFDSPTGGPAAGGVSDRTTTPTTVRLQDGASEVVVCSMRGAGGGLHRRAALSPFLSALCTSDTTLNSATFSHRWLPVWDAALSSLRDNKENSFAHFIHQTSNFSKKKIIWF